MPGARTRCPAGPTGHRARVNSALRRRARESRLLLVGRGLRAFVDGYVAVLLPAYLLALGFGTWEVGLLSTATLLGSALATLAVGAGGTASPSRSLLLAAALLMAATGLAFAGLSAILAAAARRLRRHPEPEFRRCQRVPAAGACPAGRGGAGRCAHGLFARYSLTGALCAAVGALAAAVPRLAGGAGRRSP